MRSMRRYKNRRAAVAAVTGDYQGTIIDASAGGLMLTAVTVEVHGERVPLAGFVFVPTGQVVHVQVSGT